MSALKTRLSLSLILSLLVVFFGIWYSTSATIRLLTDEYISDRLELEIESLLTELFLDEKDLPQLNVIKIDRIFHHAFSGHYFKVILVSGEVENVIKSQSLNGQDFSVPPLNAGQSIQFQAIGPNDEPLFVLAKSFRIREHRLTIAVAEDRSPFIQDYQSFQFNLAIILSLSLVVIALVQFLILHYSFKPLSAVRKKIDQLKNGEISQIDDRVPTELEPFIEKINNLASKTKQRLERSRNALGNLSHALKTPLTIISQLADREDVRNNVEVHTILKESTADLFSLIDRQLRRAQLANHGVAGRDFLLENELAPLIRTLKSLYYNKQLDMECDYPADLVIHWDRQDFLEMMGNILDNACKWAERRIVITAGNENGFWFTIEDDGPGVSDKKSSLLSERGVRLDETMDGNGLGLSIVSEVIKQYNGKISFGRSTELGGLRVLAQFPDQ
ncbi:MAG: GHKL domain-containing protein [Magnetococcales bacterium]|nr:GHKL domain-containing protein [Magnetococcales bacterium]